MQILILGLIWISMLLWRLLKFLLVCAIFWGFLRELSNTTIPIIGGMVAFAKGAEPTFFGGQVLAWVAENWMSFAIALILWLSFLSRWKLHGLSETGGYTRIFIATIMNYFQIETETPSLKKMRERKWDDPIGIWKTVKEGLAEFFITKVIGFAIPYDDRLDAKAMRRGEEVKFADDIENRQ